jgi:hypothetical protein
MLTSTLWMHHMTVRMLHLFKLNRICLNLVFISQKLNFSEQFLNVLNFLLSPVDKRHYSNDKQSHCYQEKPIIVVFTCWGYVYFYFFDFAAHTVKRFLKIPRALHFKANSLIPRAAKTALKNALDRRKVNYFEIVARCDEKFAILK